MWITFVLLGGVFVLIYFLMIRPQRRKMQTHQQLLNELGTGDDILTTSGIYGRISSFDGDSLLLEIADDVYIKVTRSSIAQKIVYENPTAPESNGNNLPESTEEVEVDTEETPEDE